MDLQAARGYTSARMEASDLKRRALLWGHLLITLPAVAAILLVALFYRNYLLFPAWLYYLTTAITVGYQWYAAALPRWKTALERRNISETEIVNIARQGGLIFPGGSAVGLLALHTTAATLCASCLNIWLAGRWVHSILPLTGTTLPSAMEFYMQHFEVGNFIPAFIVGYVICRKFPGFGSWAWLLPGIVIAYLLLTYPEPNVSVLTSSHPWYRFSYYFVIERSYPSFNQLGSSYAERVMLQITVVASFYSSVAYSIGASAEKRRLLDRLVESLRRNRGLEHPAVGAVAEDAHEASDNC